MNRRLIMTAVAPLFLAAALATGTADAASAKPATAEGCTQIYMPFYDALSCIYVTGHGDYVNTVQGGVGIPGGHRYFRGYWHEWDTSGGWNHTTAYYSCANDKDLVRNCRSVPWPVNRQLRPGKLCAQFISKGNKVSGPACIFLR